MQPARDALHALAELLRARAVAGALHTGPRRLHVLPLLHEAPRTLLRVDTDLALYLHRLRRAARVPFGRGACELGVALDRAGEVARAIRSHLVERVARLRQRLFLVRQHRQPLLPHPAYIGRGAPIAFDRTGLRGRQRPIGRDALRRRRFFRRRFRPEPGEHAPGLVAHLLRHLTREFREPDLAPIGERTGLVLLGPRIVAGHVLAPVARHGADELALVGEVVAPVMELHVITMPRHADIGAVAVHAGGGEDVGVIDGHALRLMESGGVAVIDRGIVLCVERDPRAAVEPNLHPLGRYLLDRAKRAVLHP